MIKRLVPVLALAALLLPVAAHRLDEYLQATRVLVSRSQIELRLDLTPGVAILPKLLPALDPDHNGKITDAEEKAYAERVRVDVHLELDGQPLHLEVRRTAFPSRSEMEAGEGVIHLKLIAQPPALGPGRHALAFRNDHRPELSVYLVNALVPVDRDIVIRRQERNASQREYRLVFEVASGT